MPQTWNDPALPWESGTQTWKDPAMPWNNQSLPWQSDPRSGVNVLLRGGSDKLLFRDGSSIIQRGH